VGETPLHLAAAYGSKEIIELLLKYNAVPSIKDDRGDSSLYSKEIGLGLFCFFFCPLSSLKKITNAKALLHFFALILNKIKSHKLSQTTFH